MSEEKALQIEQQLTQHWSDFEKIIGPSLAIHSDKLGRYLPYNYKQDEHLDKKAFLDIVETALFAQMEAMKSEVAALGKSKSSGDRWASAHLEEVHLEIIGWALGITIRMGLYQESIALAEKLFNQPCTAHADFLRYKLLTLTNSRFSSSGIDLDDHAQNLIALASSTLWDSESVWDKHSVTLDYRMLPMDSLKESAKHAIADFFKTATQRPQCAKAVTVLTQHWIKMGNKNPGAPNFKKAGQDVAKAAKFMFVQGAKIPNDLYEGLSPLFWLGIRNSLTTNSKWSQHLFPYLIDKAHLDEGVKALLCFQVWTSFDRKNIKQFEENFPGFSETNLKSLALSLLSDYAAIVERYRMKDYLSLPSSKWAHVAFKAQGLAADEVETHTSVSTLADALTALPSVWEALEIKASLAAEKKALKASGIKVPALKSKTKTL